MSLGGCVHTTAQVEPQAGWDAPNAVIERVPDVTPDLPARLLSPAQRRAVLVAAQAEARVVRVQSWRARRLAALDARAARLGVAPVGEEWAREGLPALAEERLADEEGDAVALVEELPDARELIGRSRRARRRAHNRDPQTASAVTRALRVARNMLGNTRVRVGGRSYRSDCSGYVTAVFEEAGLSLIPAQPEGESGTEILYNAVRDRGGLHRRRPDPGDLVFFHDTWDRNRNGRLDDRFTHVGVVERVEADGTVVFLHYVSGAVKRYRMNLDRSDVHRDPDDNRGLQRLPAAPPRRRPPGNPLHHGRLLPVVRAGVASLADVGLPAEAGLGLRGSRSQSAPAEPPP